MRRTLWVCALVWLNAIVCTAAGTGAIQGRILDAAGDVHHERRIFRHEFRRVRAGRSRRAARIRVLAELGILARSAKRVRGKAARTLSGSLMPCRFRASQDLQPREFRVIWQEEADELGYTSLDD